MFPPVFEIVAGDTSVLDVLGDGPTVRVYPFGDALQNEKKPYAVWRIIYGSPENSLNDIPDTDTYGIQIDVYGLTQASARDAAAALRNAIEPTAYVVAWNGEWRDPETKNYTVSFNVDWVVYR